jgi:hypothetical protein
MLFALIFAPVGFAIGALTAIFVRHDEARAFKLELLAMVALGCVFAILWTPAAGVWVALTGLGGAQLAALALRPRAGRSHPAAK